MNSKIGITERGDAGIDFSWKGRMSSVDGAILITKRLSEEFISSAKGFNTIVHATITGHGGTVYEPNVPTPQESYEFFHRTIKAIGRERVVLRIDPIIPTPDGVNKALKVYNDLKGFGTRIRISFADNYPHVRNRFIKAGLKPLPYNFHAPINERKEIARMFQGSEICGEPGFDCTGCVSAKDLSILGIKTNKEERGFQRRECTCLSNKTELLRTRGQCTHKCIYCYWK